MPRSDSRSPSLFDRLFAGTLCAGGLSLLYGIWSFLHYNRVQYFEQGSIFRYLAGVAFAVGFLLGIGRTADLLSDVAFTSTRSQSSTARVVVIVIAAGALWLALEYL